MAMQLLRIFSGSLMVFVGAVGMITGSHYLGAYLVAVGVFCAALGAATR